MGNEPHMSPESDEAKNRLKEVMEQSTSKAKSKKSKKVSKGTPQSKKRAAVMAAVGLVLVGLGLIGYTVMSDSDDEESAPVVEQIEENKVINLSAAVGLSEGTVERSSDLQTWTSVTPAETIEVGDFVRTGDESRAVLVLDDGSALRLNANTEIELVTSDSTATEVMLFSGQVYSRVIPSDSRAYAVTTASERFTAQGTAFTTKTDEDKDELRVFESKVLVDSEELEVDEGNEYNSEDKEEKEIDLDKLKDDEFVKWNKEQDEGDDKYKDKLGVLDILDKKEEVEEPATPTPEPTEPAPEAAAITLSGNPSDKGVSLSWTLNDAVSAADGFKVVYDKSTSAPKYQVHTSQYAGTKDRGATVQLTNGATYYFRVCAYRASSSSCDTYSNAVKVTAPEVAPEAVESGAVSLSIDGATVSWTFAGTAPHGFKVLLSSDENPTYPSNSISYVGPEQTTKNLPEKPDGTYYARVCKYTADSNVDGGCTDYSNQVEYVVD